MVIDAAEMRAAVAAVGGYATGALTRELACVLVEADGESARMAATDLDGYGEVGLAAMVEEPGRALVPSRLASEIAKGLPEGLVSVEAVYGRCSVEAGGARFDAPALPADDFPEPAPGSWEAVIEVDAAELASAAAAAAAAADKKGSRAVLGGVSLEVSAGRLAVVATDGYKLFATEIGFAGDAEASAVVPPGLLARAKGAPGAATLSIGRARTAVGTTLGEFSSRVVEGRYPDWRRVVPADEGPGCEVALDELVSALSRAASVSRDQPLSLACDGRGLLVSLQAASSDDCSFSETLACDGEPFEVSVNPAYMLAMARSVRADRAVLRCEGPTRPLVVRGGADTALVMPVAR